MACDCELHQEGCTIVIPRKFAWKLHKTVVCWTYWNTKIYVFSGLYGLFQWVTWTLVFRFCIFLTGLTVTDSAPPGGGLRGNILFIGLTSSQAVTDLASPRGVVRGTIFIIRQPPEREESRVNRRNSPSSDLTYYKMGKNQYQIVGPYKEKWVFFQNIFSQMVHIICTKSHLGREKYRLVK